MSTRKELQVAVLGAGFCGLAAAWNLAKLGVKVTIFDPLGIGNGASGVSAGLLHEYAGARARKNWRAEEGLTATLKLLMVAKDHLGSEVFRPLGLQRFAIDESQKTDFLASSRNYQGVSWRTSEECTNAIKGILPHPGIFIKNAYLVDSEKYLEGLWLACLKLNVTLERIAIKSLSEVAAFDHVVIAMGAFSKSLPELSHLKITPVKGQVLILKGQQNVPPLKLPISSQAYLLMHSDGVNFIAGATYERSYVDEAPDVDICMNDILPKINAFFPHFQASDVIACKAGVRASTKHHHPLVEHLGNGRWIFTGMGSKGLLYHALFAEELSFLIANSKK